MRLIFIPILKKLFGHSAETPVSAAQPSEPSATLPNEAGEEPRPPHDGPEVLFICTGNYYRSRFAEAVFNALAEKRALDWRAFSRGTDPEAAPPGLSPHTKNGLSLAGVDPRHTSKDRHKVTAEDLRRARRVIALKEDEHRPVLERAFPELAPAITYWDVADIDRMAPQTALLSIKEKVETLVDELAAKGDSA